MGHWENTVLEYDQLMYASTDAYVSYLITYSVYSVKYLTILFIVATIY